MTAGAPAVLGAAGLRTPSIPISIFSILYLYLKVSIIIFISPGFTGSGVAGGSLAAAAQVSSYLI